MHITIDPNTDMRTHSEYSILKYTCITIAIVPLVRCQYVVSQLCGCFCIGFTTSCGVCSYISFSFSFTAVVLNSCSLSKFTNPFSFPAQPWSFLLLLESPALLPRRLLSANTAWRTDCSGSVYCMNDPSKQPLPVFFCHGVSSDSDLCRGDGDCTTYCSDDPSKTPNADMYLCHAGSRPLTSQLTAQTCEADTDCQTYCRNDHKVTPIHLPQHWWHLQCGQRPHWLLHGRPHQDPTVYYFHMPNEKAGLVKAVTFIN